MKILNQSDDWKSSSNKTCVAIGVFDGVHLGHQQVIRQAVQDAQQHDARTLVVTFDRHPASLLAPEHAPKLIYTIPQKLRTIASLGPEATWLIQFDWEFSRIPGRDFIKLLHDSFGPLQSISVGRDFKFGFQRSGDVGLLKELSPEYHFKVHGLAAVALDQQTISSTRIRQAIQNGDFLLASQLLGRPYALSGPVIPGDQLGQKLGFPTANIKADNLVLPPNGVYAVRVRLPDETEQRQAVLNLGLRPTLEQAEPELRVETHLLDFEGNLYEEDLEITIVQHLRSEQKFPSVEDLKAQIQQDVTLARECLSRQA